MHLHCSAYFAVDSHQQPTMSLQAADSTCSTNQNEFDHSACSLKRVFNIMNRLLSSDEQTGYALVMGSRMAGQPEIQVHTKMWMAAAAVCMVQEAVLLRHLPKGCLTVAKFHGPHGATAADFRRIHTLSAYNINYDSL